MQKVSTLRVNYEQRKLAGTPAYWFIQVTHSSFCRPSATGSTCSSVQICLL